MKRRLHFAFTLILVMGLFTEVMAQTEWSDYIVEVKGDTAVIKSSDMMYAQQMEGVNVVFHAIMGDTNETGERQNLNRIYETVRGGYYYYDTPATIDATVPFVKIVAKDGTDLPPLHLKLLEKDGNFDKAYFRMNGCTEFFMQNQYICQAVGDASRDRNFFRSISNDSYFWFDNVIFELSNWAFLSNFASGCTFKLTNCLCMNVGVEASLEKGNIVDGTGPADTIWFENTTFLNFGNAVICRPPNGPRFAYFNHNTMVNATNNPFYFFTQEEMIVTNNLFINQGMVPDYPDFYAFYQDEDKLPKGIVNVDTMETAWITDYFGGEYKYPNDGDRKVLVDKNNAWWDSRLQDMFDNDLAAMPDTIDEVWASQMITMNTRAQAMFDDNTNYPYLAEGTWYSKEPDFANNEDMMDEWTSFIVTNAIPGAPNGGDPQPNWRTNFDQLWNVDWPILPDLSYTDADLYHGGVNNYPLGDLNWYPSLKATWETTGEPAKLIEAMMAGQLPVEWNPVSIEKFKDASGRSNLSAYPNPLSDVSMVKFNLVRASDVELIIYNIVGERVHRVQYGHLGTGVHEVSLEKGDLIPGMYILQLNTNYNNAGLTTKITVE